ncbi:MAG TPA: IS66 family insertion sequence element accessory protein TnpB [Clostridiales bacterium]|nr:IS66 family insertion sequence element accessory protein TnpB [Clostridiales bacterium]
MDKTTHEVRRSHWKNIIEQCQNRPEGMSAKQWMTDNSISEKLYYYWLRQMRTEAYEKMNSAPELPLVPNPGQVTFTEIPILKENTLNESSSMNHPAAIIKTSTATIALSNEISDRLLSRILQEVSHA